MKTFFLLILFSNICLSDTYEIKSDLIGGLYEVKVKNYHHFYNMANEFDLGLSEYKKANQYLFNGGFRPAVKNPVLIPTWYILPNAPRNGIIINTPEKRLYFFNNNLVSTYPVGIGRSEWRTPIQNLKIIGKKKNPTWTPTKNIQNDYFAHTGERLKSFYPAGPDNPLGEFAMRLSNRSYLIHGTNEPYYVGLRVSHGCIRMHPDTIRALFPLVSIGTSVYIINQPIKIGMDNDLLYIQVNEPLEEDNFSDNDLMTIAKKLLIHHDYNESLLIKSIKIKEGIPTLLK